MLDFKVLEYIEVITGRIQVLKISLNDMDSSINKRIWTEQR